jgi:hypothetical protein
VGLFATAKGIKHPVAINGNDGPMLYGEFLRGVQLFEKRVFSF